MLVLQRADASIIEILASASHVVVYSFDSNWERMGVEGSLFVVRRVAPPFYQFIVMNRRATNNLVENISTSDFHLQDSDPYLMYRNPAGQIIGLWFYEKAERGAVRSVIEQVVSSFGPGPAAGSSSVTSNSVSVQSPATQQQLGSSMPLQGSPKDQGNPLLSLLQQGKGGGGGSGTGGSPKSAAAAAAGAPASGRGNRAAHGPPASSGSTPPKTANPLLAMLNKAASSGTDDAVAATAGEDGFIVVGGTSKKDRRKQASLGKTAQKTRVAPTTLLSKDEFRAQLVRMILEDDSFFNSVYNEYINGKK